MAAGDGLISMTPTSIAYSGTSASINADGGVDFSAVTSLSLNGVFTGDYDNYLIVVTSAHSTGTEDLLLQLRASGTDATGSDYVRQRLNPDGSSVTAARQTSRTSTVIGTSSLNPAGTNTHVYGPALTQPTAFRNVNVNWFSDAAINENANTHSLSTSYDGFTISTSSGNNTGTVHVFGYEE